MKSIIWLGALLALLGILGLAVLVFTISQTIRSDLGVPSVLIHNAVGGAFGSFLQIDPQVLERNFQVNTMGLLHLARRLAPAMIEAGRGVIIATGNTSALRGKANFAGFAPTKAAQRILAEVNAHIAAVARITARMARALRNPRGISYRTDA